MEVLLAILIGLLFAVGVYLVMRRDLLRVVFGLMLLSNGVNLLIFTMGRLTRGVPPVVPPGLDAPLEAISNPLPQALVLTAIVIGFGFMVFALLMVMRTYESSKTMVSDEIASADGDRRSFGTEFTTSPHESEEVSE